MNMIYCAAMTSGSILRCVLFVAALLAASVAHGQTAARYEAMFVDGRRLEGDKVSGWGEHPASPRLGDAALFDAKRPLRWLRDRSLKAWSSDRYDSYIEFVGGDRLVGRIEGAGAGDGLYIPAHLLVKPAAPLHQQVQGSPARVRILPGRIQRVVFRPILNRRLHPGMLYYLDGRKVGFVDLRWKDQSVVLLLKNGTREIEMPEIAEVHLPPIDPWAAYYQELATLSPACRSRMERIETIDGLIATTSSLRLAVLPYATDTGQERAAAHVERLDRHIAGLERQRESNQQKFEQARAKYQQQLSESKNQGKTHALKRRFEQETRRWEGFLRSLELARSRRAATNVADGNVGTWRHILQPVWSLDPLWVPFDGIRMRWSFAPEQVPLCRVRPAATLSPPFLAEYTNRGWAGGPLHSGGQSYAWGFAVHAYSELRFPLPQCATAFRGSIGLDSIVGPDGCARARVYVGSTRGKCAYESPLLIGSKKTVDSGRVALKLPSDGPRLLVLQADPVDRGSPSGADPLNIRDKLDWLDPRLELDTARLREQVRRQVGPLIGASPEWTLRLDRRGVYTWTSHFDDKSPPGKRRFWTMLQVGAQPLSLLREMTIAPADKWLVVHLGLPGGENPRSDTVTLRVGERKVRARKVPIRQSWQDRPAPLVFPLAQYQGKKVTLELTQGPGGKPLHWQSVSILTIPPAAYRLVDIIEFVGKGDMKVPYGLGQALQSKRITKTEKLAALEINQFGGIVNFRPSLTAEVQQDSLVNVLVGRYWTGGDKTFIKTHPAFKKMPSLKTLLVTPESGISDGAIAKLHAEMPKLTISRIIRRVSSLDGGRYVPVTWRNGFRGKVVILWIDPKGKLQFSSTPHLEPGRELRRSAYIGVRYEAHYARDDYAKARDYFFTQPLSSFAVADGAVWEIKP
ncbi:MAG: NPCBM/NEW2 domain-containing protein [Planctomycetes bacterium]|nr:NPCBM/NEW2 domain-containing protein [Planctomycetota bacterium]